MQEHRDANRDRTCLQPGGPKVALGLHGSKVAKGVVTGNESYCFFFHVDGDDEPTEIHKLQVKYAYDPADWKRVKKAVKIDKAIKKAEHEPVKRPQDRYSCSIAGCSTTSTWPTRSA